jgi:hypothetical protein
MVCPAWNGSLVTVAATAGAARSSCAAFIAACSIWDLIAV